jgi:hypothetical protein
MTKKEAHAAQNEKRPGSLPAFGFSPLVMPGLVPGIHVF